MKRTPEGAARVGIDAAPLDVRGKGVARYLLELLPALASARGELELVVLTPRETDLPEGAQGLTRLDIDARPAIAWEQLRLARASRKAGLSLVHTLTDRLPVLRTPRSVVYLFEDPRHRTEAGRGEAGAKKRVADALTTVLFPGTLRRAELVVTSSEATRRDLVARGIADARLRVVYPGIGASFRAGTEAEVRELRGRLGLPDGYLLHLSSDDPRDNSAVVLEAYAAVVAGLPTVVPLVVKAAPSARRTELEQLAGRLGLAERVRWLGYQSDAALAELYRGASTYVDPSLYEGFGFQVAEALASGAPVVCSNTTSLPEVVGEAGLLVAPDDVRGFASALSAVLGDNELAARLAAHGVRRAASFSWSKTATETVALWQALLAPELPR